MPQILAHLFGDYILQSDWMAQNKTKRDWPAFVHALVYAMCFLPFVIWQKHPHAFWLGSVICGTHFLIDRYRLARYVVWAKNWLGPWHEVVPIRFRAGSDSITVDHWRYKAPTPPLSECPNGYPGTTPIWISTWLLIIADNTLHLAINYLALRYL